jgi:hypothetical protein
MKIVSSGQTGAEIGGLVAAKQHGVDTGGFAVMGFETEDGNKPEYELEYNLVDENLPHYAANIKNVIYSDSTFIFTDYPEAPCPNSIVFICKERGKPYAINPTETDIIRYIKIMGLNTINIYGDYESITPGIEDRVKKLLLDVLGMI